jgi:hypothetical protein
VGVQALEGDSEGEAVLLPDREAGAEGEEEPLTLGEAALLGEPEEDTGALRVPLLLALGEADTVLLREPEALPLALDRLLLLALLLALPALEAEAEAEAALLLEADTVPEPFTELLGPAAVPDTVREGDRLLLLLGCRLLLPALEAEKEAVTLLEPLPCSREAVGAPV